MQKFKEVKEKLINNLYRFSCTFSDRFDFFLGELALYVPTRFSLIFIFL